MSGVILWTLDLTRGKYLVADESGAVLLGPFFSDRNASLVGQRLANTLNRPVVQRSMLVKSGDPSLAAFDPA